MGFGENLGDGIKEKFKDARMQATFAAQDINHAVRYRAQVDGDQHKRSSEKAGQYMGEVLSFLRENPAQTLSPLNPTLDQINMVHSLLRATKEGTLVHSDTRGMVAPSGSPYVARMYSMTEPATDPKKVADARRVSCNVLWDVKRDWPLSVGMWGRVKGKSIPRIDLLALKEKAQDPKQLEEVLGDRGKNVDTQIGVFQEGERIVVNSGFDYKGKHIAKTQQFYLLGSFHGEGTDNTYWLYGSNSENQQKQTVTEAAGAFQPATKPASI